MYSMQKREVSLLRLLIRRVDLFQHHAFYKNSCRGNRVHEDKFCEDSDIQESKHYEQWKMHRGCWGQLCIIASKYFANSISVQDN